MIDTLKKVYLDCASSLNLGNLTNYKTGTDERKQVITDCADGYIKATETKDELKRSQYISALMLLFWPEIQKMADKCKAVPELEFDDFAGKLYECIDIACQYREWQNGTHTAEACIRKVIGSRGAPAILYESNLDKNKANVNLISLDATLDDTDSETTRISMIADESANKPQENLSAQVLIQNIINNGNLIDGIVLDTIAFNDCNKENREIKTATDCDSGDEYKYAVVHKAFSEYTLAKLLTNLSTDYKKYFVNKYIVPEAAVDSAINRITTINKSKLYKMIRATLEKQKAVVNSWFLNN